MKQLPDSDRKVIDLISVALEDKTDELLTAQDKEITEADKSMLYNMAQMTEIVESIRTRYHNQYMVFLRTVWDGLSYDDQIVFCKYYHTPELLMKWMDECQITALKLIS